MANKPRRPPKQYRPQMMDSPEREYYRNLLKYQQTYSDLLKEGLKDIVPDLKDEVKEEVPSEILDSKDVIRMDANIEKDIRRLFELVRNKINKIFPEETLRRWAASMIAHTNSVAKNNTKRAAKQHDLDIEPLLKDEKLNPFFNNVIDENVGLIKSITEDKLPTLKNALVNAISSDMNHKDITKIVQKYVGGNKNKAAMIARDQVGKLNGKLNQYRQQQLGGKKYIWRTVEDVRVRPDHAKLDGKTFSWDNPPIVDRKSGRRGNPGNDFQCRCYAEMVFDDIV